MQTIDSESVLRAEILRLETNLAVQRALLKENLPTIFRKRRPTDVRSGNVSGIVVRPVLKYGLLKTAIGLSAGFLAKLAFDHVSRKTVKKMVGNALLFGAVNLVARNPGPVIFLGQRIIGLFKRNQSKNKRVK